MFTRRQFLKNSALLGSAAMFLPGCASQQKPHKLGPNDKLRVAIIGPGNRGSAGVSAVFESKYADIVAFCDPDERQTAKSKAVKRATANAKIPLFHDYRVMLDKMDKDIDAVTVCTPDHMHYPISAWAMAKGKHVYCEKPLARTIWETREMRRLAQKAGVTTQMGNQGHTMHGWKELREWTEAGLLGEIEEICMWTNRPIWPQGAMLSMPPKQPIPTGLDY
ncbi:MAG: Gfo/Idh/MocA family oxidoreductase, partial [Opitutales bacterium]|nr:Gfo/Idh/MocA family oxidoreductase [Opitutales bacterium]